MTNVQMLVHITGGRADGTVWPHVGHDKPLKVSKAEAEDLYLAQLARPWPGGEEDQAVEAAAEAPQAEPEPETEPEPEPEPGPEEVAGSAPRPAAPKSDWVDWAVAHGVPEGEANAYTKQQLMERYGDRP